MSKVDEKQVRHIALLGRIHLDEAQIRMFGDQLSEIVTSFDKLNELDTDGVEPMAHAVDVYNVLGEDVLGQSLSPEQALKNAPDRDGDLFSVPKVIGDSQ